MRTSEEIDQLAAALAKAQAVIEGAIKDKQNPAFRSKYADLGAVWDAIREPMTKHGLSVAQVFGTDGDTVVLFTRLMHTSGQWIEGVYPVIPTKLDPQGYGSAATYARRYSLMAMLGVAPEDDDGSADSQSRSVQHFAPPPAAPARSRIPPLTGNALAVEGARIMERIANAADEAEISIIEREEKSTMARMPEKAREKIEDALYTRFNPPNVLAAG